MKEEWAIESADGSRRVFQSEPMPNRIKPWQQLLKRTVTDYEIVIPFTTQKD